MTPERTSGHRVATYVVRPEKVQQVEALRARLADASAAILTDYRGLNTAEITALRGRLREAGADLKVVKNTLFQRAAQSLGIPDLAPFLQGPTAVVFAGDDPVAPARVLVDFIRQMRKLEIKGGLVEGRILTAEGVRRLADLPSRSQLLAMAAGALRAPLAGLAGVTAGLPRALVSVVEQIRRAREQAA
ncbi:MAG: 50S ribosomal protein L10 [Armatimonadota bacterium]|nr:50S ribosomal protein L10 [Armatimonadota bacterium]